MSDHPINLLFRARDQASRTIASVNKELTAFGRASRGAHTAARNLGRLGAVGLGVGAAAGIVAIRSGLESLAEREDVISATEGAIRATGQAAQISAGQVRGWAEALETATGAAVDDKAIQAGANTLIRFKVASERSLAAAVDLGAGLKTGPEAGAKLLGKALADPVKGMTALRKAGVVLTAEEQKRIKALVKANKVQEAQGALLAAVESRYKGAAAASAGPYTRSLNMLADASEDAKMALAEGFLPVIERFAGKLRGALDDPATMRALRDIGSGLADAADGAVDFVSGLPWDKIRDGLGKAADFAKTLVGAFTSLPPEAQATIIALAGLDKLSGGAVSGIVGELGKGLIKGVLGMTAGVVNVNAAVVNGGGGGLPGGKGGGGLKGLPGKLLPGAGLAGLGAAGVVAGLGAAGMLGLAYGVPALTAAIYGKPRGSERDPMRGKLGPSNGLTTPILEAQIGAMLGNIPRPKTAETASDSRERSRRVEQVIAKTAGDTRSETIGVRKGVEATKTEQAKSIVAFRAGERTSATGLSTVASTTRAGATTAAIASANAASRIVGAVAANGRPTVNVYVSVPGASVRYGAGTGSAGQTPHDAERGIER